MLDTKSGLTTPFFVWARLQGSRKKAEVNALWAEEAEKRVQALEQGLVVPIDGQQVLRQLCYRYQ